MNCIVGEFVSDLQQFGSVEWDNMSICCFSQLALWKSN